MSKKDNQVLSLLNISKALNLVADKMLDGEELTDEYKSLVRECIDSLNTIVRVKK